MALSVLVVALVVLGNVVIGVQLHGALTALFGAVEGLPAPRRDELAGSVVVSAACTSAAFALLIAVIAPPYSMVSLAARIAGGSRRCIALGEAVPAVLTVALVTAVTTTAPAVALASTARQPVLVGTAVFALSIGCSFAVLAVRATAIALLLAARAGDLAARAIGSLVAMLAIGALLADLLSATLVQRTSAAAVVMSWLWRGRALPASWLDLLATASACAALVALCVGMTVLTGSVRPLAAARRLVPLRPAGRPGSFGHAVLREVMLQARHPVTVVSTATLVALIAGTAVAARTGVLPAEPAAVLCAVLCAAGAETARGRTRPWSWIARLGPVAPTRAVSRALAQLVAVALAQGGLFVAALVAAVGVDELGEGVARTAPVFLVLLALAYLAGVMLPYSDHAPLGAAATAVLVVCFEVGWLFADAALGRLSPWARLGVQAVVIAAAFAVAVALTMRDDARMWGGTRNG